MKTSETAKVITILKQTYPTLHMEEAFASDAYKLLVAVLMSARTRDVVTIPTAKKLFNAAGSPQDMVKLPRKTIETILHPIGFSEAKAGYIQKLSRILIEKYDGKVPGEFEALTELPGVGRKTANVVLAQHFRKDVIAVDTHVHRITNRLGWLRTNKPDDTEKELKKIVPKKHFRDVNHVFVRHGQEICLPGVPLCEVCPVFNYCKRVGVKKFIMKR